MKINIHKCKESTTFFLKKAAAKRSVIGLLWIGKNLHCLKRFKAEMAFLFKKSDSKLITLWLSMVLQFLKNPATLKITAITSLMSLITATIRVLQQSSCYIILDDFERNKICIRLSRFFCADETHIIN